MIKLPKEFVEIPEDYRNTANQKGLVEKLYYEALTPKGEKVQKYLFVYTPYGYDPSKEYEMVYLIHGGHELPDKYLYLDQDNNYLKCIIDHLIENKEIKPCIICTPTWYPQNEVTEEYDSRLLTLEFHHELSDIIMPFIESKYHTYAKTADEEGFVNSRDHRVLMGWSMGSVTTWFTMMKRMRYFNRYGNMSADCFLVKQQGCINYAPETVAAIVHDIKAQGYGSKDFTIMVATGTNDGLRKGLIPQMEEMKKYPELFKFDGEDQNMNFYLWENGEHHTPWRLLYTYNVIKTYLQ